MKNYTTDEWLRQTLLGWDHTAFIVYAPRSGAPNMACGIPSHWAHLAVPSWALCICISAREKFLTCNSRVLKIFSKFSLFLYQFDLFPSSRSKIKSHVLCFYPLLCNFPTTSSDVEQIREKWFTNNFRKFSDIKITLIMFTCIKGRTF